MKGRLPSIKWTRDREFWSAEQAEHAIVGNHELVALNLQPTLATGKCATFEEAKTAAEAALVALLNPN